MASVHVDRTRGCQQRLIASVCPLRSCLSLAVLKVTPLVRVKSQNHGQKRRLRESSATSYGVFDRKFDLDSHEWSCFHFVFSDHSALIGHSCYLTHLLQAMMCRAGEPVRLMTPHKPNEEEEKKRIEAAGGVVIWYVYGHTHTHT